MSGMSSVKGKEVIVFDIWITIPCITKCTTKITAIHSSLVKQAFYLRVFAKTSSMYTDILLLDV
jgi:hypothetical protein